MNIFWFRPTANHLFYVLPTITYIKTDATKHGCWGQQKVGDAKIINLVWLYWAIVIVFGIELT
jgi:hypothetical protein